MKNSLASLLLALLPLSPTVLPRGSSRATAHVAEVRDELAGVQEEWDAARTSFDTAAFERMLAPDFWVEIGPSKLTRSQFIEQISQRRPGSRLARFDSRILTLSREQGAEPAVWAAVVQEKLEVESQVPHGEPQKSYSLWVTKDRFRKDGERWVVLSSQAVGWESWVGGQMPPFDDWSS